MFDLSTLQDAPLAIVALAVIYNLVLNALKLHHERKTKAIDEATHEKIVELSSKLAAAEKEIEHLKEAIKNKGA